MTKKIEVKNISKTFLTELGDFKVLDNISFDLYEGEIISILGPSGSGKSTLLNNISGLLKIDEGEIIINGKLGYMFQKDHLLNWRTVWKNITLGLEINKNKDKECEKYILELLEKYNLKEFVKYYPNELSGGMRQRIALIRTLAVRPNILLLDEAFSALDYQTRLNVTNDVYKMIKNEKLSAILVTHDIAEAISISDRIIVLSNRPAKIKSIYEMNFDIDDKNPINIRKSQLFSVYFDKIWNDLNG